jgi:CBS-domain-containing membrane protein
MAYANAEHPLARAFGHFLERIVRPAQRGLVSVTPLEIVAGGVTIMLLMWMNDTFGSAHDPLLIPPFAASIALTYYQPKMSVTRTWNVVAGQFLGALGGFVGYALFPHSLPLAAGIAMMLGVLFQRITHSFHPPGIATGLIIVLDTKAHAAHFLVFPVLVGSVLVVIMAWLVHGFEITVLHRLERALGEPKSED